MGHGLATAWTDFGRRTAVIAGACVALGSLVQECPVWVASARGAGTMIAVGLLVHGFARLLAWSSAGDREDARARIPVEDPLAGPSLTKSGGARG